MAGETNRALTRELIHGGNRGAEATGEEDALLTPRNVSLQIERRKREQHRQRAKVKVIFDETTCPCNETCISYETDFGVCPIPSRASLIFAGLVSIFEILRMVTVALPCRMRFPSSCWGAFQTIASFAGRAALGFFSVHLPHTSISCRTVRLACTSTFVLLL